MMAFFVNHKKCFICAGLVAAVMLAFWPALHFGFINYDDPDYVTRNWHVRHGLALENIQWSFTHVAASNWHPVTWISHMLDCQLFDLRPLGHHLVSLLLHAANAALLFALLWRLTGAIGRSALVAAIFAVHPLRVESVVWISERKDVLSGFFFFLTMLAYVRNAKTPNDRGFYFLSLALFAIGLMAKPMLVTVPVILLLLDFWPLQQFKFTGGFPWKLAAEKIPFFALSIAASLATFLVQRQSGATADLARYGLALRLANMLVGYVRYIAKNIWPSDLVAFYPRTHWSIFEILGALAVLLLVTGLVLWKFRSLPQLSVGWLWFIVMLLPVIGIIQAGGQSLANRFTYLPGVGLWIAIVWGLAELPWRPALGAIGGIAVVVFAMLARQNTLYYSSSEILWQHTLSVYPNCIPAENNLIRWYIERGEWDKANSECQKALALDSLNAKANDEMSQILLRQNRLDEAMARARNAIGAEPENPEFHETLARADLRAGNFSGAAEECRTAIDADPTYAEAWCNLGFSQFQQGKLEEAAESYRKALALNPDYALAHNDLGNIYLRQNRMDDAAMEFQRAAASEPNFAEAHYNLAGVLAQRGDLDGAIVHCQKAVELQPQMEPARQRLAALLAQRERTRGR